MKESGQDQQNSDKAQLNPRILWVDDEEYLLATVQRLLRNTEFELTTCKNPIEALSLIKTNEFDIVVSDQRMPQMTGIELLKKVKDFKPNIVRLMITGFLDQQLLKEAVNQAGVYRFINKPWNDDVLLNDLRNAIQQASIIKEKEKLLKNIALQNKKLSVLTSDLESLVEDRTKNLLESRNLLRKQEEKVRNLIRFIQELSESNNLEDLFITLRQELRNDIDANDVAIITSPPGESSILVYMQSSAVIIKKIANYTHPERVAFNEKSDQMLLANLIGRPISKMYTFPLQRRSSDEVYTRTTVFFEITNKQVIDPIVLATLSEKIQPLSIAIDRVLVSETLREVAANWEETFDNIDDPISIIDKDFNCLRGNQNFKLQNGSEKCFEVFANRNSPCVGCTLLSSISENQVIAGQISLSEKIYEVRSYPLKMGADRESTVVINHYTDITEGQKLYGQLIQSEKMAALGVLAGNIAHELNNPLTGISSLTQFLISKIDNEQLRTDLQEIHDASARSQTIIKNLLEFASESGTHNEITSLNEIIKKTLPLLKTVLRHLNAEIKYHPDDPKILVNAHLIQQVVFNLVTNASHAMPEGGELTVEVFSNNNSTGFLIKDTGHGISEVDQKRIFEPFFTTKKEGRGTGLGLSMCESIVREFGGKISLKSQLGVGSEFKVEFNKT